MGLGFRVFIVNDDDSLQRISLAGYERLFREDSNERLVQYAGKQIRCALVVLHVENRKPQSIARIECNRIPLNARGEVDLKEWVDQARLITDYLHYSDNEEKQDKIIDANKIFAQRRHERESRWSLTPGIERAIEDAIFGNNTGFPRIV